jgi:DNA-binding transcriptional regulator YdaS (Cro superfamily)
VSFKIVLTKEPNQSEIARICGVTPQAVAQWKVSDTVPLRHVRALCEARGFRPHDLRPDYYDPDWRFPRGKRSPRI